jgi:hypothetical protein
VSGWMRDPGIMIGHVLMLDKPPSSWGAPYTPAKYRPQHLRFHRAEPLGPHSTTLDIYIRAFECGAVNKTAVPRYELTHVQIARIFSGHTMFIDPFYM